jgi:hypothetical protein
MYAAFDKIDTEKMFQCMRQRGISEWVVQKKEKIYLRKNKKQSEGGRERRWIIWDDKGSETGLFA